MAAINLPLSLTSLSMSSLQCGSRQQEELILLQQSPVFIKLEQQHRMPEQNRVRPSAGGGSTRRIVLSFVLLIPLIFLETPLREQFEPAASAFKQRISSPRRAGF